MILLIWNDFLSCEVIVCTMIEKISKNALYCDIQINGVNFKLLVDPGSPKTLLSSSDYEKLGKLPLLPPQTHLTSYSSEKIPPIPKSLVSASLAFIST